MGYEWVKNTQTVHGSDLDFCCDVLPPHEKSHLFEEHASREQGEKNIWGEHISPAFQRPIFFLKNGIQVRHGEFTDKT